ncbi:metal ABC transporter solute-binding protein, Zn/Mn family [Desulfomonile tiedjei]|uniref:ABC-type metal ion transport system, periplasmic component/surface adhesin n=1 Tax=Desulfomonile tiedjei (strain ATCC 49306 / DSM 6799 / DCB-1) TaxID=706587 RepID=I4CCW5_DESTA|nr:zinc ABC transporter substrate-binding protein [Desulfomonile tiedjei]AFM27406.1 ABC-type metal ion transport system, periplasmic component/surface adhesin [Desulfomonile tiedjei DSM 6799]
MKRLLLIAVLILAPVLSTAEENVATGEPSMRLLRIGVTLHPYYSYVANIVGDKAEVVPLIQPGFNPHNYRPQPEDIKRLVNPETKLDALVVNGVGHDEFAFEILKAAGLDGKLPLIYANKGVAMIPIAGSNEREKIVNPHTFVSITASIEQVYNIAKELGNIDPANAAFYRNNARAYAHRLRKMKADYMKRLANLPDLEFRCATLHGGYDYLLQDFGLQVAAVIEPKHGLKPTAIELAETIAEIKEHHINVVFTEMDFPDKVIETIQKETGIRVRYLSHLTAGEYEPDAFEKGMRRNLENLTNALLEAHGKEHIIDQR